MQSHIPVLASEVLNILKPSPSKSFADFTFGLGGHTQKLLSYGSSVIGLDRDYNSIKYGNNLELQNSNFKFKRSKFSNAFDKIENMDGILFDLGVSSVQIDESQRGFSFMNDGPLSMQMGLNNKSAADIINSYSENDLADILYYYADETKSRSLAKKIILARRKQYISTTFQLINAMFSNGKANLNDPISQKGKSPATKAFQALRIATNNELSEICTGLQIASKKLKVGGRLAVITFHSIEDRIVKYFFKEFKFLTLKPQPIFPEQTERKTNSRSRSAKLRWGIKI